MKMKKIYLYLSVAVALTFTSCNEWLDIQPELEMRQNTMFESEQGFKDVLTGAYIRMATPELYGLNTTMKLPEKIRDYIPGERFSIFDEATRRAFALCDDLRRDHDLESANNGVTIVVL